MIARTVKAVLKPEEALSADIARFRRPDETTKTLCTVGVTTLAEYLRERRSQRQKPADHPS